MATTTLIAIGIFVVGTLMSIIGFFIAYYFRRSAKSNDDLNEAVGDLQISVTALNGTLISQDEKFDTFTGTCRDNHTRIDKRLYDHGKKIDNHEKRISTIEGKG